MFTSAVRPFNLILVFAVMHIEIVSSALDVFNPCENGFLSMSHERGEGNNWDGFIHMYVFPSLEQGTIRLKLTAPAEVTLWNRKEGRVDFMDGEFILTFFPPESLLFDNTLSIHVQGEQGGAFPNVQSLKLNGDDVCPNPPQWKIGILGVSGTKKDTVVSNASEKEGEIRNDSEKKGEVSNNVSKKDTEVNNNETALKCGKRLVNHQGLIKSGELTKEGDWPWHAAIFHQEKINSYAYKCGGVLLNKNTVLTAAHCVVQTGHFIVPERVLVKLGLYHRFVGAGNVQDFQVFKIIPHENFNSTYLYNDIAILKLSTEATYTNYVQPVCLWPESDGDINSLIGQPGDVIGWGFYDKQNKLSDYLGYGTMPIVSVYTCLESNRPFFGLFVSSRTFCAGYRNGTSVCNGDSGGGMFFEQNGAYLLRGLVSVSVSLRNKQVCDPYEYVLFTDVAKYLDWIRPKL